MSGDYRHATDRKDWTFITECSEHGDDHVRLTATAKGAAEGYQDPQELFPFDECPGCGAEMAYIQKDEFTEELA